MTHLQKSILPNPFQTVVPTSDQTFKYMILEAPFSIKLSQAYCAMQVIILIHRVPSKQHGLLWLHLVDLQYLITDSIAEDTTPFNHRIQRNQISTDLELHFSYSLVFILLEGAL